MAFNTSLVMRNGFSAIKTLGRLFPKSQQTCSRLASTSSDGATSPIYELRMYALHPKQFKTAMELYNKNYQLRLKHSKLFGFWTSEIGDHVTQFVHIWEYDSLSHRRDVRKIMAGDETWNTQFLPILLPCIAQWKNSLMLQSPGSSINTQFTQDPAAVYVLDQSNVSSYEGLSDVKDTEDSELLVGRFLGILGHTKREYKLWRFSDIDAAVERSKKRVFDAPCDGSSILLYPTAFSPLQ